MKKLHSSLLSHPFSMMAMMIGMALLGAAGAMSFRSGKDVNSEGNPAPHGQSPQVDRVLDKNVSGADTSAATDNDPLAMPSDPDLLPGDDPFSEESLGFVDGATNTEIGEPHRSDASPLDAPLTADQAAIENPADLGPQPVAESTGREHKITQQAVNLLTLADEQLASGSYVQAMRAYQTIRQKSQGAPGTAILIRLALCAEAAGRRAAALEAYRKVAASQSDPAWSGVARYGEARCLAAVRKQSGLQTDMLRRVLLDESEFLPTVRSEVLHLIGRDLWREQSTMPSADLLDDKTLTVPEWSADPARLLDELPLLLHETPYPVGPVQFEVLHFDDTTPDGISVRLSCGTTRLETLLNNLIQGCRLQLEVSAQAAKRLEGRTQQVHINNQRLAVLLDGMTIPYDLCWKQDDQRISVFHRDELTPEEFRECRLTSAERILRVAVTDGATSRQIGHSRLALATLLYERQRPSEAVQFLQVQIETEPRSVVETEAAFNLGKCLMALNQRNESREAFLRSIDAAGGLADVKIAAYIFTSRLFLEDNQSKLAISNMMRGVSLSEGTTLEPHAALQLASAYLIFGNPQGANSVLMERRDELTSGVERGAAAFVSSLARFRAAVLTDRREREGRAVVAALSEFNPERCCGGHWAVLVAEACEDLGLDTQSNDAYQLALRKLPASWLRDRTVVRLASRYQHDREFGEASHLLESLTTTEANELALHAKLKSAEISLEQNQPDDAIQTCRLLIDATDSSQLERAALKIMGQAFERKHDHQAAIYCFAGMLPQASAINTSSVVNPAAGPAANERHGQ